MNEESVSQLYLKDTAFQDLMQRRIFNVLLVASPYDAFMMEEDGRVEEQLYFEYVALNPSPPPRVTRVSRPSEALDLLAVKRFDLIIMMPGIDLSETFVGAKDIKSRYPDVPIIVLTPFSKEVSRRLAKEDLTAVDYVFSWLGNVDLLLAIIKLLEDKMNADNDINEVGVQLILLVEDSVRFYSSVLPTFKSFGSAAVQKLCLRVTTRRPWLSMSATARICSVSYPMCRSSVKALRIQRPVSSSPNICVSVTLICP